MTALAKVMQAEIVRLARKEARQLVAPANRSAVAARHDMAALKRRIAELEREFVSVKKAGLRNSAAAEEAPSASAVIRYSGKGVRAQRERFGMSARDFGMLLGVSSQAIYNWEQGVARPRPALLEKLTALRELGKREAATKVRAL
jgi:DNA-binding transcriptional regulator YiaG